MATADVRAELECSVCLYTFTDPVNLTCGHTFCRLCIDRVLDTQETSGGYSCPECREEFVMRPTLHKNIALRKILENIVSADQKETQILCTYCVDSSVPAVKSCLLCEASLCEKHLKVHSKSPEHVLCDPNVSPKNRKCSIHKRILEYYCTEDSACICVSCRIDGTHHGHRVDKLDVASKNRKKKLTDVLKRMMTMREETEERVQSLIDHKRRSEEKADGERERVISLFRELRRRLEDLEKRVLRDITGQAERVSLPLDDLISELKIKNDELSRKMRHIEELCNMADPLTILQESDTGDLCNIVEGNHKQRCDTEIQGDLDFSLVSHTVHKELSTIMTEVAKMMPASTLSAMSISLPLEEVRGTQNDHTEDILEEFAGAFSGARVNSSQQQLQPHPDTEVGLCLQRVKKLEELESSSEESKKEDALKSVLPRASVEEESMKACFKEEEVYYGDEELQEVYFDEEEHLEVYYGEEEHQKLYFDEEDHLEVYYGEEEHQEVYFDEEEHLEVYYEEEEHQEVYYGKEGHQEVSYGEEEHQEVCYGEEEHQEVCYGEEEHQDVYYGEEEHQEVCYGEEEHQEVYYGEEEHQEVYFEEEVWCGEDESQEVWFGEDEPQEVWFGEDKSQEVWFGS